jgi:hypothetical protein
LEEKWETQKIDLKDERMKERESGARIRAQMRTRTRMKKQMKNDVELKEVLVAIQDMMERKECNSRNTRLERLWPSQRCRLTRRLDSEEEEKVRRMPREKIES